MSDAPTPPSSTPSPAPAAPASAHKPGYFNQAQLADIKLAGEIVAVAQRPEHATALASEEITTEYVAGLVEAIAQTQEKTTATGQAKDKKKGATLLITGAERDLIIALQGIQSAAKQKHRMLDEDDDPTTNFPLDGYLIGKRLNPNRATLLQNTDALIVKATADKLPGYTAAKIALVSTAKKAFEDSTKDKSGTVEDAEKDRVARDKLIKKINARRLAIQHAADRLHPYTDDDNLPARHAFQLPDDRPFNG